MDPITLTTIASGAVAALIPFLKKGGDKLADKIAEEGFNQRGKIWETVKGLFVEDELTTLNLLADDPENSEKQADVRSNLRRALKDNPAIAKELDELIKSLPQGKTNTMNVTGSNNQSFQDIAGSQINVNGQSDDE